MSYPPPTSTGSPTGSPQSFNGETFSIGLLLGELRQENRRQTEIMLAMLDEQRELPGRLAALIPPPASAPPPPGPSALAQWADLLKAAAPVLLILGVIIGKITMPDALPVIRHAFGLQ
ncbi:MAG: hypothetical protein NW216_07690 [Hyphomicrobium sp.]|nr:hypothetical protein [Hyphomicrobium sp.]